MDLGTHRQSSQAKEIFSPETAEDKVETRQIDPIEGDQTQTQTM